MIRFAKHMNVNYIVVDSTIEIDGIILPTQVQVNIDKIKELGWEPKINLQKGIELTYEWYKTNG